METMIIDKKIFGDLVRLMEEMQDRLESLELANDSEFMESLGRSKEQIRNRDFGNWDEL